MAMGAAETGRENMTLLSIGTKIYYTGDMANQSGFGEVIAHRSDWGMDIRFEDGRAFNALTMSSFSAGPGRRFMTLETHKAERAAQIAQMHAEFDAVMARREQKQVAQ
jgi:hypothetical protein